MKRSLSPQAPRMSPSRWTVRNLKPDGTVPKKRMMIYECQVCLARFEGMKWRGSPLKVCPNCGHPDLKVVGGS